MPVSAYVKRDNRMIPQLTLEPQTKNEGSNQEDPIVQAVIDEMNKKFAVLEQPTFLILEENQDGIFSLDKKQSLKDRFSNQLVDLGKGKKKTKADIFLSSPRRRTFRKIVMNPKITGNYEEGGAQFYNLWSGLAVIPRQGCCEKTKQHMQEVICAGNQEHFEYLLNLLANWVQKPEERT